METKRLAVGLSVCALAMAWAGEVAWAVPVYLPGAWYDTDKYTDLGPDESGSRRGWWFYKDSDEDGVWNVGDGLTSLTKHMTSVAGWTGGDIGAPPEETAWSWRASPASPLWRYAPDNSCWMGAANNMYQYMTGSPSRYEAWAYHADWPRSASWTWMNGNGAFDALHQEGFDADDHGNGDGHWSSDPSGRVYDWLRDGLAVTLGVTNKLGDHFGDSSHIVTCYGIDPAARKITIACSDTDEDDGPFALGFGEYTYEFGPYTDPDGHDHDGVLHIIGYGDSLARVNSVASFYTNDWQGNGASGLPETDNNCRWSNRDNWSQNHMPNVNYTDTAFDKSHIAKVVFDRPGRLTVDTADAAATKLILRGPDTFVEVLHDAQLALGSMLIETGRMDIGGRLTANRADSLGGWIQVPGGTVEIGRASPGNFTASGITTVDVDAGGTVRFGQDVIVAPDSGGATGRLFVTDTAAIGGGGTVTVDGSVRIGTGCQLAFAGPELQVNIAGDAELPSGSLSVSRSPLTLEGTLTAGTDGIAAVYVLGAAVTLRGLHLGQADGSTAYLIMRNQDGVAPQLLTTGHLSVGRAGSGQVTQDAGTVCRAPACTFHPDLTLGGEATGQGTYTLNGGALAVRNLILSGYGRGTFTQNGGTLTVHGQILSESNQGTLILNGGTMTLGGTTHTIDTFTLGADLGSDVTLAIAGKTLHHTDLRVGHDGRGRLDLADCTVVVDSNLHIGYGERGEVHQDGGTVSAASLAMGLNTGGEGRYDLTDGTLDVAGQITLGNNGSGTLTQRGDSRVTAASLTIGINSSTVFNKYQQDSGTAIVTGNVILGGESGSYGTYHLAGTMLDSSLTAHHVLIGQWGTGRFEQIGGRCTIAGDLALAQERGSDGTYYMNGGELGTGATVIGVGGAGGFDHRSGTHNADALRLGAGGKGTYALRPSPSGRPAPQLTSRNQYVGDGGPGEFTHEVGTNTVTEDLHIGRGDGCTGSYVQTGGSLSVGRDLRIGGGAAAIGTYTLTAGVAAVSGNVHLGDGAGASGEILISNNGTSLTASGEVRIGGAGTGRLTVANIATFTANGTVTVGGTAAGEMVLSGGLIDGTGRINVACGTGTLRGQGWVQVPVSNAGAIVSDTSDLIFWQDFSGPGTVAIAPSCKLGLQAGGTLDGPVTNQGYLSLGAGTVHLNGGMYDTGGVSVEGELLLHSNLAAGLASVGNLPMGAARIAQDSGRTVALSGLSVGPSGTYVLNAAATLGALQGRVNGLFDHAGGTAEIAALDVGGGAYMSLTTGEYRIASGRLEAGTLRLGDGLGPMMIPPGRLNVLDPAAEVVVTEELIVGPAGLLSLVPGAKIRMTGSAFVNKSQNPMALVDLIHLTLVFQGGSGAMDPFEVAGADLGASMSGFVDNFALGTLQLGCDGTPGQVRLVDLYVNQPGGVGAEALYVSDLILDSGGLLDLNGHTLYYLNLTNLGGTVLTNGGHLVLAPEPATLALLAIGVLALLGRRRRA